MTLSTLLILAVCRTLFIGTGGWLHCHLNAKGCASARDKCNLDPHCCPGRRGPASAGPNAFPGEILELKNKVKKKLERIWTCTDYSFSFQRAKTGWILEEKSVFSFRWRGEKWSDIRGSHLVSTEYRCPNRSRWRAHLRSAGLSLGLVSAMNSVVVGNLAKCILRQLSIAYFHIRV